MAVTVRHHERPPVWRNVTILKWIAQIISLIVVLALFWILGREAARNFTASGISFGWDWLSDPPGISLREGIDTLPGTGARALLTGAVNTLRVSISGILAATLLGTLVGIARLSKNWIVNKIATFYIETIRNIPLLVQIFFWSALITTALAPLEQDDVGKYVFKASNKGIGVLWTFPSTGFWPWFVFVLAGFIVARYVARWRIRVMEETGHEAYSLTYALGTVLVFALIGWFAHPLLEFFGAIWRGIESFVNSLPVILVPAVIAVVAVGAAAWFIRNFFESRRTPAGFGKLTDDDWFRVTFAAFAGIAVAVVAFVVAGAELKVGGGGTQSVAELLKDGTANFFGFLGDKFTGETGNPLTVQRAEVEVRGAGFIQYGTTGLVITPPFFAIWVGVTLYTAAFIAEIVRGGILAVSKGQTEAAQAVGLRRSQYLRLIILPQAFRIILPPMGNQYLNLFKNTSLGIAVAFPDIVQAGFTLINQTGQSLPIVLVWMAFFLTGSLLISLIVNYYNRRLQLVER